MTCCSGSLEVASNARCRRRHTRTGDGKRSWLIEAFRVTGSQLRRTQGTRLGLNR